MELVPLPVIGVGMSENPEEAPQSEQRGPRYNDKSGVVHKATVVWTTYAFQARRFQEFESEAFSSNNHQAPMDPHSTRLQFNRRAPKAGPLSRSISEKSLIQDNAEMSSKKRSKREPTSTFVVRRPIATNSRVKQDEMLKRDMYLSFVTNALQEKLNGDTQAFDELVAQFNMYSGPYSSTVSKSASCQPRVEIRLWLVALSHVVSRLERTHATLVDTIVNMPWMTLDNATVKSYTVFIGMLLSARPEYLSLVLTKITQGLTYQSGIQALNASLPSTSSAPLTRRTIYDRLHYLLRHLLSLIPTLPSTLQSLLVRYFPHKRQNHIAQTTYVRNLLRISSYCPELSDKILATIVDRAIQIDVEIQIELEELEELENLADEDVFELDPFDTIVGQDPSSDSDEEDEGDNFSDLSSDAGELDEVNPVEVPTNISHFHEMVNKLDAILVLLFKHFERTILVHVGPDRTSESRLSPPSELPPLPALDMATPGLNTPLTPILGPPFTQAPDIDSIRVLLPSTRTQASTSTPLSTGGKRNIRDKSKTALHAQFHTLLSIFDRTILRTFKSRYTQFLLFWYTSLDPEFADVFQGMLVERALMPASCSAFSAPSSTLGGNNDGDDDAFRANASIHLLTPEVTRAAAASYIGGFVSRAKFVDHEGTRRVISVLCEYMKAHLDGVDEALREGQFGVDGLASTILASGQHMVFYAVAQAVFLIFCFRWRDLVGNGAEEDEDEPALRGAGYLEKTDRGMVNGVERNEWMPELAILKRAVVSVLNPLKVCSSNVVMQFARIAHATDFMYCYTILDANKRSESANSSPPRGSGKESLSKFSSTVLYESKSNNEELNTFFPFDPCRLPKSHVFVQEVYREWESVAIQEDEEDEEDEDGDYDDKCRANMVIPVSKTSTHLDDDSGLGKSLGAMSISPAPISALVSAPSAT